MSNAAFMARVLAARERWITLDDQREVRIRRPAESRMPALLLGRSLEDYAACVTDWRGPGFTEAGILGAKVASDTPVPFGLELWTAIVLDNVPWLTKVAEAVREDCAAFMKARESASGN